MQEWTLAAKEGDVTDSFDNVLAKQVYSVQGTTSATGFIQLPASKHLPKSSLGLTGRFVSSRSLIYKIVQVYVVMQAAAGKQFVLHFDYVLHDTRTVRLSFSNLYKETKVSDFLAFTLGA